MILVKSKKQLDEEKPTFPLLQPDDYELVITSVEEGTQPKYKKPEEMEDVVNIKMDVVAYRDGGEAIDKDGNPSAGRKVFFTARPNSLGFKADGTPAKSRCILAYGLGFEIENPFEFESWEQLLDKKVFGEITIGTNQKGAEVNKLIRFIPPKRDRKVKVEDEEIPVINK